MTDALRRNPGYRLLFGAVAVSQAGSQVTLVALPLVAVLVLDATPLEMGLLAAAGSTGFLLVGLPAGVWVDRSPHRPVLIGADLVRAALLVSVPAAAAAGLLSMAQLYVVGLLTSVATVFFDVAYQSHVPSIAGLRLLAKANGQLEAVGNLARMTGPGAAGWVVQLLSAPVALIADAVSYLFSALLLARIRTPDPRRGRAARTGLFREVLEGLRFVFGEPVLRVIVLTTGASNLFAAMTNALTVVFLARTVGLPSGQVGMLLAAVAAGGLAGSMTAARFLSLVGTARGIMVALLIAAPFGLLVPLTRPGWGVLFYVVGGFGLIAFSVVYNVATVTYRQTVTPPHLLGRMTATIRFVVWGVIPLGALAGGVLAELAGVRTALWIAAAGELLAALVPLFSPLRRMRDFGPGDDGGPLDLETGRA